MRLSNAETKMLALMEDFGLLDDGWHFKFDRATRRFGSCNWETKTLTLSKHLVKLNDAATVRLTMLHEIAHALVSAEHGHDKVWKAKAREIGHSGNRCYSPLVKRPKRISRRTVRKWVGVCPNPLHDYRTQPRTRRGELACADCCKRYNHGKFDKKYLFVWEEAGSSRFLTIYLPPAELDNDPLFDSREHKELLHSS